MSKGADLVRAVSQVDILQFSEGGSVIKDFHSERSSVVGVTTRKWRMSFRLRSLQIGSVFPQPAKPEM